MQIVYVQFHLKLLETLNFCLFLIRFFDIWHTDLWGVPGPWTLCSHGRWPRACRGEVPPPPRGSMATWQRWQCPIALGEWRSGTLAAGINIIWKVSKVKQSKKIRKNTDTRAYLKLKGVFLKCLFFNFCSHQKKSDTKMASNFPGNLSWAAFRLTFCLMPARQLQESGVVFDKNAPPTS